MSAVARHLLIALAVTFGGSSAWGEPPAMAVPQGSMMARDVYRVTNQAGQVLLTFPSLGRELGRGGLGVVHQVEVQMADGTTTSVAVKTLQPEAYAGSTPQVGKSTPSGPSNPSTTSPFHESHQHLARYFQRRPPAHIHAEVGGLLLRAPDGSIQPTMISEVVSGNVYERMESFRMYPHVRDAPLRIERIHQLMRDSTDGVIELAAAGLMHGDIKPANIFHKDGARYLLADLDQVTPLGKQALSASVGYLGPEFFTSGNLISATERDTYALANSLYQVAFGELPWREYVYSDPESLKRFKELIAQRLADPQAYRVSPLTVERFQAYLKAQEFDEFRPGSKLWQLVYTDKNVFASALMEMQRELMVDEARYNQYLRRVNALMVMRLKAMGAVGTDRQRLAELQAFIYRGLQYHPEKRNEALRIVGTSQLPRQAPCPAQFGNLFDRLFLAAFPKAPTKH